MSTSFAIFSNIRELPMAENEPVASSARMLSKGDTPSGSRVMERLWFPISLVLLILVWEFGVRLTKVNPILFPTPASVVTALWDGLSRWGPASFYVHFWRTMQEVILG